MEMEQSRADTRASVLESGLVDHSRAFGKLQYRPKGAFPSVAFTLAFAAAVEEGATTSPAMATQDPLPVLVLCKRTPLLSHPPPFWLRWAPPTIFSFDCAILGAATADKEEDLQQGAVHGACRFSAIPVPTGCEAMMESSMPCGPT